MDELAVNQSIFERAAETDNAGDLGWGTAAAARGISGANRGAASVGGKLRGVRMNGLTFGTFGVKEPAFLELR